MMDIPQINPTPYKISTITATGSVNTCVNLDSLFSNIVISEDDECNGIIYVEYGNRKSDTIKKGTAKKKPVNGTTSTPKKRFDNQVTIVYRYNCSKLGKQINVNCKIFKNGNVQMTGLRYIDQGIDIIDFIIHVLKDIYYKTDNDIVGDITLMTNTNYRIRLINCDFKIGIELKRDKLYSIVLSKYSTLCTYEPCIYPGVKVQYWWNKENVLCNGACYCKGKCDGKGCGVGDGECKKITIAVFQSGCIIITGGQSIEQINDAYDFICLCIKTNIADVYKTSIPLPQVEIKKKKVYIKKSTIRPIT